MTSDHQEEEEKLEDRLKRNKRAIEYLETLMNDTSGYQERAWPILKRALEKNRMGNRRLFND